jgi:hypothetical protein
MPFFGLEPFDAAEATYVWTGAGQPGFFQVTVRGHARKISFGFQLRRDTDFVGGLAIEVMGWTGPLTVPPETTPYTVTGRFNGRFLNEIVVIGSNKTQVVHVREAPFTTEEEFMRHFSTA